MSYSSAAKASAPRAPAAASPPTTTTAPTAVTAPAAAAPVPVVGAAARHEPLNSFNAEEVEQHLQSGEDLPNSNSERNDYNNLKG